MRIGTRITITTSALAALTLGIYGWVTLRGERKEREMVIERQARELAQTLRVIVEVRQDPSWVAMNEAVARQLERSALPWRVSILPLPPAGADEDDPQVQRLRRMEAVQAPVADRTEVNGVHTFILVEPIRAPPTWPAPSYRIIGAVQVSRALATVDQGVQDETLSIILSMFVLILILVFAVSVSTRRGIGRPIDKLLAGIDDVAKGDLSHVLLAEREDEIGALAARFNEMTKSLRDAREETRRGVEERLALESRLRNTAQLATIGQLAAEIAHEVGTPLNVVTGRARTMAKKADDPDAVQKNATIIAEQAGRITRIIQRLLDVARRTVGGPSRGPVDLHTLAESTLELLEHQIADARIRARAETSRDVAPIPGDRDQLQQVLLNLFMNSIQAMPSGGKLDVRTRRVVRRRPGLEMAPEQDYVVLEVADTGVGIPEEDRAKIFEAFYTSKSESGGTGLGLAVAHGIVKDHDGWIEIDDNSGGGTVFRIYLPSTETSASASQGNGVLEGSSGAR
jgi:signal transduction histidine kinase